ncbi:MAG: NlpC/P60 family protein [Carbonactinosporaceae bacterium]
MRRLWLVLALPLVPFLVVALVALAVVGISGVASTGVGLAQGTVPRQLAPLIVKYGQLCPTLNPPRLAAQLYQESGFDPRAVSPVGARGMAQFMPATWEAHGVDADGDGVASPWNPVDAIASAAHYDCALAGDVRNLPGDAADLMLAAYNAGPYTVLRHRGVPPYEETRDYLERIEALERAFAAPRGAVVPPPAAARRSIAFAFDKLGTPYLWGGEGTPAHGGRFDCSGLTQAAYRRAGVNLPRTSREQWYAGPHVPRAQLRPGDLVFFAFDLTDPGTIHHVGIYVGNGHMINAPFTGAVIRFDPVDQPDYIGAVRPTLPRARTPDDGPAGSVRLPGRPAPDRPPRGAHLDVPVHGDGGDRRGPATPSTGIGARVGVDERGPGVRAGIGDPLP